MFEPSASVPDNGPSSSSQLQGSSLPIRKNLSLSIGNGLTLSEAILRTELPLQPLLGEPCPDPYVIRVNEVINGKAEPVHWMTGTSFRAPSTFLLYRSTDGGQQFDPVYDGSGSQLSVLTTGSEPAYFDQVHRDRWAPEIHFLEDRYLCLFTARHTDGNLKIEYAEADAVQGQWRYGGTLISDPDGGVIDATIAVLPDGYAVVWKFDGNADGRPTPIYSQRISVTPGGPVTLEGTRHEIMRDGPLDGGLVEGQFFVREPGADGKQVNYVFYSSHCYADASYTTWVGTIDDVLADPVQKPNAPFLHTGSRCMMGAMVGPGHPSLVREGDGLYSMYFHAWPAGTDGMGIENRLPYRVSVSFRDEQGHPCAPFIVEERYFDALTSAQPLSDDAFEAAA